ncbi:hypothetical protein [Amycolatopsis sp. NPDC051102]|uniref:hypothetical protein n=1 Tax=Amycolatopsis sp. NPDC051102 TaxID=3155163 RepID=UPI0034342A96
MASSEAPPKYTGIPAAGPACAKSSQSASTAIGVSQNTTRYGNRNAAVMGGR